MNLDFWHEIYDDLMRKPSRTILTGVGISWGILILIVLVSIGTGFQSGVMRLFNKFVKTSTYVYSGQTTKGYKSTSIGKQIMFKVEDLKMLHNSVAAIEFISPEVSNLSKVYSGNRFGQYNVKGVCPDYFKIRIIETNMGRILNYNDSKDCRKVALIGKNIAEILFKGKQPIGNTIKIGGEVYQVIGIIKNDIMNSFEEQSIYIPYETYLMSNPSAKEFSTILYSTIAKSDTKRTNDLVKHFLARKYIFSPDDNNVLYFNSMEDQVKAFNNLFATIKKFLWFIGISTLISGIIGVGNIMYTTAKERTREIGILKSIGASSLSIKKMFIYESITLTTLSGLIGMALAYVILQLIGIVISEDSLINKLEIDLPTGMVAILILVTAGTLIGLRPAVYASSLNPIDALREEN